MRLLVTLLLGFIVAAAPLRPEPAVPYFTNLRDVHISQPDRQNFFYCRRGALESFTS